MPTFKVSILANNEAGNWTSWEAKKAALRDFYAPVCTLDITLIKTTLKPEFSAMTPTSSGDVGARSRNFADPRDNTSYMP